MAAAALTPLAGTVRVPGAGDAVHKEECLLCFDTPESEGGLYVCLNQFVAFSRKYVELYHATTGRSVFLHTRTSKHLVEKPAEQPPAKKPTKMAIGVEGGFDIGGSQYEYTHEHTIVVLPSFDSFPLDAEGIPDQILLAATGVITAVAAARAEDITQWEEERKVTKHADTLIQLDNGVKVPPSGWKCAHCELTDNLWMNLTDGTIVCGRRNYDGSGGNNHGADYYEQTRYPLAVKLGTITPEGADVFSYDEGDMVVDPKLSQHLEHFGISMASMRKTVATMAEMEIEMNANLKLEFDAIQEAGSKLEPLYGPGYTGLRNLGNTCYLNSVMQVLFSLPEVQDAYTGKAQQSLFSKVSADAHGNFSIQMAKLGTGLLSGDNSQRPPEVPADSEAVGDVEQVGITPKMFKTVAGRGHAEFSTPGQQVWNTLLPNLKRRCFLPSDTYSLTTSHRVCRTRWSSSNMFWT